MSHWISFASGGGTTIQNPDITYEQVGFGSGDGTVITGTSVNTKGSYVQLTASTSNNWSGFYLSVASSSSGTARFLMDISLDGGSTIAVPNLFIQPGAILGGQTGPIYIPLNVASGANIQIRTQTGTTNASFRAAIIGAITNSQSRPCFSTCTALTSADTATTLPGTIDIPLDNTWEEVVASTSTTYGAIQAFYGAAVNPGTAQTVGVALGVGAASSEVELIRTIIGLNSSSPPLRGGGGPLVEHSIPSGSRLSARCYGPTPASDNIRAQLFGFS